MVAANVGTTIWFIPLIIRPVLEIGRQLDSLSQGNLTAKLEAETSGRLFKVTGEFNEVYNKMNEMAVNISVLISSIKNSSLDNIQKVKNLFNLSTRMSEKAQNTSSYAGTVAAAIRPALSTLSISIRLLLSHRAGVGDRSPIVGRSLK